MLGKDLVSIGDLSPEELTELLDLALRLKRCSSRSELAGKMLALVFQKPSLRTRVSFEVAMGQLGGRAMYLSHQEVGLGQRESIADVARVLSRMVDGIVARTYRHDDVVELARSASVPVINGLSDDEHPCQILADLLTIREHAGRLAGLKLAWVGDGNNVLSSLMIAAPRVGLNLWIATPPQYQPADGLLARAADEAAQRGAVLEILADPKVAVRDADFVYTDTWYSMGSEGECETRRHVFRPYQVNAELLTEAGLDVRVLHCLPAHRGEEITDEIIDGPASIVLEQAESRVHAQKALLVRLMADRAN